MGFDVKEWYRKIQEGEVILSFEGDFTSDLITNVLGITESKLNEKEANGKLIKILYTTLVECLQNLYHHSLGNVNAPASSEGKYGVVVLLKLQNNYRITTGNFVNNQHLKVLKDRIDQINSLTKDELKALYKLILNNEEFSEKGGGGLGMIDVARKTGSKLEYSFYENTNDTAFYELTINISNIYN